MLSKIHYRSFLFCFIFYFISIAAGAQAIKLDEETPLRQFPYISMVYDRIFNSSGLDTFFHKLELLKRSGKGSVSIVHIGDSHVKAPYYPGKVKKCLQDFFGAGGKDSSGVIYNSIGINGARFTTFNRSAAFWQKLPSYHADLYIISLGTNDAQGTQFNEKDFLVQVQRMIDSIRMMSPGSALLFTTAADSFRNRYPNRLMWSMNISLYTFCAKNNIPVWDLYRTTNGYGSAYNWIKQRMMSADGVHYSAKAYELQGQLLFNAIGRGYNNFLNY